MSKIEKRNAVLFGISTDTVESHKGFHDKEHLNFPLLADPGKETTRAYGVLSPAGFANRVTFLIDPQGVIRGIDRTVNAEFSRNEGKLTTRHGDVVAAALTPWKAKLGAPVPDLWLPDSAGKTVSLYQPGKKATVVVFAGSTDEGSRKALNALAALAKDPAYKDVAFVAVDPVVGDADAARALVQSAGIPFPFALDTSGNSTARFGVTVIPTVWVLDGKGIAVYDGAVEAHYVKDAVDAVLAGRPVATPATKPVGLKLGNRKNR